jgi:dipeptidase D
MPNIQDLEPKGIWKNFYLLTQVPRPSGHLEKVQQFLLDWAKERNVEAFKDNAGNIVMRKPATPGMEDRIPLPWRATWTWFLRRRSTLHTIS